jgi:Kdo2-lipid IVA lauroyltransferase/acyltransferase
MNILNAVFLIIGIGVIGILPVPLLYGFSNIVRLILYNAVGYRKKIVRKNLKGSFPAMAAKDIEKIIREFYNNLADIFLEGLWAFTMSRKQIYRRHRIINMQVLEPFMKEGKGIIAVPAHYANWEWGSVSANSVPDYHIVAFYKRINNRYVDKLVRHSRSKFGTTLVDINETSATFEKLKGTRTIYIMAMDQGMPPKFYDKAHWTKFLNRDTPFLKGMEKHAKANDLPVVYVDVQRVKRGFYELELTVLAANPNELPEGALTELYARKLESVILRKPQDWLWSHNRWRIKL